MEFLSDLCGYAIAVLANARTGVAFVVFVLFSLPNAALPDSWRQVLDARFPTNVRRPIVATLAVAYLLFSGFLVWRDEHQNRLNADANAAQFAARLDEREKNIRIRIELSKLAGEGLVLLWRVGGNESMTEKDAQDAIMAWERRLKDYIDSNLDDSYYIGLGAIEPEWLSTNSQFKQNNSEAKALLGFMSNLQKLIKDLEAR